MTVSSGGPPLPATFVAGDPDRRYDVQTTASFTGAVTACVNYSDSVFQNATRVRLLHLHGGIWLEPTQTLSAASKTVCGEVQSLGLFTVAEMTTDT